MKKAWTGSTVSVGLKQAHGLYCVFVLDDGLLLLSCWMFHLLHLLVSHSVCVVPGRSRTVVCFLETAVMRLNQYRKAEGCKTKTELKDA